jgi:hypothetical protein
MFVSPPPDKKSLAVAFAAVKSGDSFVPNP